MVYFTVTFLPVVTLSFIPEMICDSEDRETKTRRVGGHDTLQLRTTSIRGIKYYKIISLDLCDSVKEGSD